MFFRPLNVKMRELEVVSDSDVDEIDEEGSDYVPSDDEDTATTFKPQKLTSRIEKANDITEEGCFLVYEDQLQTLARLKLEKCYQCDASCNIKISRNGTSAELSWVR